MLSCSTPYNAGLVTRKILITFDGSTPYSQTTPYPDSEPVWSPCGIQMGKPTLPIPSPVWDSNGIWMGLQLESHCLTWPWASPNGPHVWFDWACPCPGKSHCAHSCPGKSHVGLDRACYQGTVFYHKQALRLVPLDANRVPTIREKPGKPGKW